MDAGLAAVIAGATGAGGAALAAFATSFGLLRQAKLQGDHAHRQWLRGHQQQAYEEFLVALDRTGDLCRDVVTAAKRLSGESTAEEVEQVLALFEGVRAEGRALRVVAFRVTLLTDAEVSDLALDLGERQLAVTRVAVEIAQAAAQGQPLPEDRLNQPVREVGQARGVFISRARKILQQA
ncbi:hypothetical protein AB0O08_11865 [Streptomyces anulatus]|uniref:hypothetical protein n=1 Tax=Streptomyces anulatus TaxID=1892 RepID=UPI00341A7C68